MIPSTMANINFQLLERILKILVDNNMEIDKSVFIPDDDILQLTIPSSGYKFHNELIAALKIIDRLDEAERIEKVVLLS
jgi:hypothetical protein